MNICDRYFSPVQIIDLDECVGLSLATINENFRLLQEQNCFHFNEVELIQAELSSLYIKYTSLSALRPQIARGSISFNGTGNNPLNVYTSFNISVQKLTTGTFELSFAPNTFFNTNYALVGTCNDFAWIQPLLPFTTTTVTINIRNRTGILIDPEYISLVTYNT
jgi:hypothetical protein